jgi:hypothetical protein
MGFASEMKSTEISPYDSPIGQTLKSICQEPEKPFCLSITGSTTGTAFLFRSSDLLATSLHNVRGFLKIYWENVNPNQLEDIRIPLVLKQHGQVVFGPGDVAKITVSAEARAAILSGGLDSRPDLDVAVLWLSKELGTALQAAPNGVPGEDVTIAGYLNGTFQMSTGREGMPADLSSAELFPSMQGGVRFATYFAAKQLSGSPVLNNRQQVVGMHTGTAASTVRYYIPFVRY